MTHTPLLALTLALGCSRPVPVEPLAVEPAPLPLEGADPVRGEALVHGLTACGECHGADLAGKEMVSGFPMGRLVAPNLTTLDYQTADWVRAIRHGVDAEGHKILLMPSDDYAALSQRDLADIVAFLEGLAPVARELPESRLGPVGSMLVRKGEWPFTADRIDHSAPIPSDPEAQRGAYLAQVSSCMSCHGGGPGKSFGPGQPVSGNLTPHPEGLADWSRDDFARAVREGLRPDGSALDPMMPSAAYAEMSDADVDALWAYLQSLPPQPDP